MNPAQMREAIEGLQQIENARAQAEVKGQQSGPIKAAVSESAPKAVYCRYCGGQHTNCKVLTHGQVDLDKLGRKIAQSKDPEAVLEQTLYKDWPRSMLMKSASTQKRDELTTKVRKLISAKTGY